MEEGEGRGEGKSEGGREPYVRRRYHTCGAPVYTYLQHVVQKLWTAPMVAVLQAGFGLNTTSVTVQP